MSIRLIRVPGGSLSVNRVHKTFWAISHNSFTTAERPDLCFSRNDKIECWALPAPFEPLDKETDYYDCFKVSQHARIGEVEITDTWIKAPNITKLTAAVKALEFSAAAPSDI